ncbi:DUF1569 domain-containing protein [Mucilaginibacter sp. HC2]|uniref:DUF1569 domain-containing protein n=1 Tax=Mucilaginibacter inviolabilis TaxID=2714892 RepID=UPI00140C0204|nr:DUF1569 domain-containing protein [Mucilaginibacter inviolabilis]NHA04556.1 DUF1569 domain-containing protein [Mucilaginibacter inviolabilis]
MKSIFDQQTRDELINRVNSLNTGSKAQWGKMNVYQMVRHCSLWEDMMQGKQKYKQAFIGRIFGKMALRKVMKEESPLARNTPTLPELRITSNGDMGSERTAWITKIRNYANFSNPGFIHPFFGNMTEEQIGYMAYKHTDHHLRQFGA